MAKNQETKNEGSTWIVNIGVVLDEKYTQERAIEILKEAFDIENISYNDSLNFIQVLDAKKASCKFELASEE